MTMTWQTIDTAPKDGSRVKVRRRSGQEYQAEWREWPSSCRSGPQWWLSELGQEPKLIDVPIDPVTHWMPSR